ncbi:hypothetical protein PISL3812_05380 [Talaromyces islandicus]|uniref:Uncharacterized protein n=1 Tax=Talaromyces islandicus TaxID=28573 RepID=A0A0U1M052_TALIS|nr:hypothetical protein PISL3812_05380 [Talaromyces islandicus]
MTKVARNSLENKPETVRLRPTEGPYRTLRPGRLCKMGEKEAQDLGPNQKVPDYLFVCWTSARFPDLEGHTDSEALQNVSETATKDEELEHYWLSSNCMGENTEINTWRMSDVIRGAKTCNCSSGDKRGPKPLNVVGEMGLPGVSFDGQTTSPLERFNRCQLAMQAWGDQGVVRQLADHFENNLSLGRLEMSTIALRCLYARKLNGYLPGDHAYALMGLARIRPTVNKGDSDFQAFARISLANDNDQLLERLACVLPKTADQPWYDMEDAYGASLWDIYPDCQIAGVGGRDEMIILNNEKAIGYGDTIHVQRDKITIDKEPVPLPEGTKVIVSGETNDEVTIQDDTIVDYVDTLVQKNTIVRIGGLVIAKDDVIDVKRKRAGGDNYNDIIVLTDHPTIVKDYSIVVDGARAANVKWDAFAPVYVQRPWQWSRLLAKIALHTSIFFLILGALFLYLWHWIMHMQDIVTAEFLGINTASPSSPAPAPTAAGPDSSTDTNSLANQANFFMLSLVDMMIHPEVIKGFGILFVAWSGLIILLSPWLIRTLYDGQFSSPQPWLFGFEGYLPIEKLETLIFGNCRNRLRWHPYGPPLSQHKVNEFNECISIDPSTSEEVNQKIEDAKSSTFDKPKALRPPVVVLLLGREGGMQRAMGCSYDWTTGTLIRESVLRMETAVREKMDSIPRVKIGLRTRNIPVRSSTNGSSSASDV